MKMKKMIYLAFALLFLSANGMKAQVAIGTNNPNMEPHTGAILDLGQVTGKNLGLLLPQVTLNSATDKDAIQGKAPADGLLVYNPGTAGLAAGAYVWYDDSWHELGLSGAVDPNIVTDYDGNSYKYACFGEAGCWMQENLRTTKYADGTAIDLKSGSSYDNDEKLYAYPNDLQANAATLGLLYTWAAASGRTGISVDEGNTDHTAVQGVCPDGWHLPSDQEWSKLEQEIDKDATKKYATSEANPATVDYWTTEGGRGNAGEKMKCANKGPTGGETNGTSNTIAENGFNALLVGTYGANYGENASFWSSSAGGFGYAWYRRVNDLDVESGRWDNNRSNMWSVRCKKND